MGIKSIEIQNFKSIKNSGEIKLKDINVLIGANGSGKSNFIEFFEMLKNISNKQLQRYIETKGGADSILHFGKKNSDYLFGVILFDNEYQNEYKFKLIFNDNDNLIFDEEESNTKESPFRTLNTGHKETILINNGVFRNKYLLEYFNSFRIYHFNDTSFTSKMKSTCNLMDYPYLYEDGRNLVSILYRFFDQYPKNFEIFEYTIKSVAPFFEKFYLVPNEFNKEKIILKWIEKGQTFFSSSLSDGTLRFICLATILLFPEKPETIILDEPELGLHPFAIEKLAAMIRVASKNSQIIISTQSVDLINQFSTDDIIVVKRENNETRFKRQSEEELKNWLEDYSIGEIWRSNIIGGNP